MQVKVTVVALMCPQLLTTNYHLGIKDGCNNSFMLLYGKLKNFLLSTFEL